MPALPTWFRTFLARFKDAPATSIIKTNLLTDAAIDADTWRRFCRKLFYDIQATAGEPEEIFNNACSVYALAGPRARLPEATTTLNRAVAARTFVKTYLAPFGADTANFKRALRVFFGSTSQQEIKLPSLAAPSRPVWAYFPLPKDDAAIPDPVELVNGDARRLRDLLGLECSVPPDTSLA